MSLNNAQILSKILLIIRIFAFFYFQFLIFISYYPVVTGAVFMQILGELLSIHLLLILIGSFVLSLIKIVKNENRNNYSIIFCINLITIVLLTYYTYSQETVSQGYR